MFAAVLFAAVAVSASKSFDPDDFKIKTSDRVNLKAEARLEISVDFFVLASDMDFLAENATKMSVYATVIDYNETVVDPSDSLGLNIELSNSGRSL